MIDDQPDLAGNLLLKSFGSYQSQLPNPSSLTPIIQVSPIIPSQGSVVESWATRMRKVSDKTLKRLAPPSYSPSGTPRILIPDEVFQRGAALLKDFIIGFFYGKVPPYGLVQSVLSHMWGKRQNVEIHP